MPKMNLRRCFRFIVVLIGAIIGEKISNDATQYFHIMMIAAVLVWVFDENKGS